MTTAPDPHAPAPAGPLSRIVVAIDGPSGSGKSSTSRGVAERLQLRYLDTGAMYRAMTSWMLEHGVDVTDPRAVAAHAGEPRVEAGTDPRSPTIEVDGVDVSVAIRGAAVTEAVSLVSAVPEIRARLLVLQREVIGSGGVVVEGRDIGTVVAPDAAVKVYLVASADARARRRQAEMGGVPVSVVETQDALHRRDTLDTTRVASPLACADDAVVVDSTDHTLAEVTDRIVELVRAAAG